MEEMEECVQTLRTLDDLLTSLRTRLAMLREKTENSSSSSASGAAPDSGSGTKQKAPDYRAMQQALDLTKAKRLIHARECAINNTKTLINKYNTST